MRDLIFISHANPEDNEFAQWLALKLANEGYPPWCDLTELLGGEDFWCDAEDGIRRRAAKFLYVVSKSSNEKKGTLKELHLAENVAKKENIKDFVIPLLIDDLPYDEFNIRLQPLNAIPFRDSWAYGLKKLLEKMEKDKIPKDPRIRPAVVTDWWKAQFTTGQGLLSEPDNYWSNLFPVIDLPKIIYLHMVHPTQARHELDKIPLLPFPAFRHGDYVVSFANIEDFSGHHAFCEPKSTSIEILLEHFLVNGSPRGSIDKSQAKNAFLRLLRYGWEKMIRERGLSVYKLSDSLCFYFRKGVLERDIISCTTNSGHKIRRNIVGYKTVGFPSKRKRYWHFATSAKPLQAPELCFSVRPHVLFSDDGKTPWDSPSKMHRARRSQCKDWWNDDWRDRILACMHWLSSEAETIELPVASDASVRVSNNPIMFTSEVSYVDPGRSAAAREHEELDEYDRDEGDNEESAALDEE